MLHGLLCGVLYTESPGTAPVPKMQINVFTGSGGGGRARGGWGRGASVLCRPHSGADIAGHDGCCQRCCLATQYPSRKSSSLAGSQKQAGLVHHGIGHGKIIMVLFQLLIITPPDFLYGSTHLRVPRAVHQVGAGKSPGFLNYLQMGFRE